MELEQSLSNFFLFKSFEVSTVESMKLTFFVRECLKKHEKSPIIALKTHVELTINSVHLTFSLTLSEKRANEKLSEAVKSSLETFVGAVKVVVGVG